MGYEVTLSRPPAPTLITVHADSQARSAIETELRLSLPTEPVASIADDLVAIAVGPTEWLLIAPPDREGSLVHRIDSATRGLHAAAVVVSDALSLVRLSGPQVTDVLSQAVAVDIENCLGETGAALRCGFGKTSALMHRVGPEPTVDIYVESTLSAYAMKLLEVTSGKS